jgi:chromosome segregation ATPase
VVNELRNLKKQALRDTKRSEKNAVIFGKVIDKYDEFKAQEQANILKEEEAVKKLETLISSIRENTQARRDLIASYEQEIEKADSEVEKWKAKRREVASVIEDIGSREEGALGERQKWMEKKEVYKKETKKWAKETGSAKKVLLTFEKIRD